MVVSIPILQMGRLSSLSKEMAELISLSRSVQLRSPCSPPCPFAGPACGYEAVSLVGAAFREVAFWSSSSVPDFHCDLGKLLPFPVPRCPLLKNRGLDQIPWKTSPSSDMLQAPGWWWGRGCRGGWTRMEVRDRNFGGRGPSHTASVCAVSIPHHAAG